LKISQDEDGVAGDAKMKPFQHKVYWRCRRRKFEDEDIYKDIKQKFRMIVRNVFEMFPGDARKLLRRVKIT
jgi:hypothetical protein